MLFQSAQCLYTCGMTAKPEDQASGYSIKKGDSFFGVAAASRYIKSSTPANSKVNYTKVHHEFVPLLPFTCLGSLVVHLPQVASKYDRIFLNYESRKVSDWKTLQSKQKKDNYQPGDDCRKSEVFPLFFSPAMKTKPFSSPRAALSASASTSVPVSSERDISISKLPLSISLQCIVCEHHLLRRAFPVDSKEFDSFSGQFCMFEWDN